jgi:peptidoglycan/LPS O-acetylase OafA/YrhL
MATKTSAPESSEYTRTRPTAWRNRDWETLFVVGVIGLILLATLWMVLISMTDSDPDNKFRILPAAAVMVMVEVWLIFYLPRYDKLAFWGTVISLATYLFFAVPFLFLGLLPTALAVAGSVLAVICLVCGILLYRQRDKFFPVATSSRPTAKKP